MKSLYFSHEMWSFSIVNVENTFWGLNRFWHVGQIGFVFCNMWRLINLYWCFQQRGFFFFFFGSQEQSQCFSLLFFLFYFIFFVSTTRVLDVDKRPHTGGPDTETWFPLFIGSAPEAHACCLGRCYSFLLALCSVGDVGRCGCPVCPAAEWHEREKAFQRRANEGDLAVWSVV